MDVFTEVKIIHTAGCIGTGQAMQINAPSHSYRQSDRRSEYVDKMSAKDCQLRCFYRPRFLSVTDYLSSVRGKVCLQRPYAHFSYVDWEMYYSDM